MKNTYEMLLVIRKKTIFPFFKKLFEKNPKLLGAWYDLISLYTLESDIPEALIASFRLYIYFKKWFDKDGIEYCLEDLKTFLIAYKDYKKIYLENYHSINGYEYLLWQDIKTQCVDDKFDVDYQDISLERHEYLEITKEYEKVKK